MKGTGRPTVGLPTVVLQSYPLPSPNSRERAKHHREKIPTCSLLDSAHRGTLRSLSAKRCQLPRSRKLRQGAPSVRDDEKAPEENPPEPAEGRSHRRPGTGVYGPRTPPQRIQCSHRHLPRRRPAPFRERSGALLKAPRSVPRGIKPIRSYIQAELIGLGGRSLLAGDFVGARASGPQLQPMRTRRPRSQSPASRLLQKSVVRLILKANGNKEPQNSLRCVAGEPQTRRGCVTYRSNFT